MAKRSKRYQKAAARIDRARRYPLDEAVRTLVAAEGAAKFDETVELAVKLGVDPRQADQNVRGTVVLPHGTGKSVRVLVFAKGDKAKEAEAAGADHVGAEEVAKKIQDEQWLDFDTAIATPDMMGVVGRLGKILGPRGLMPNPKVGTVTFDISKAVREIKAGKVEFRVEKAGIVHVAIGKRSFGAERLLENAQAMLESPLTLILGFEDPVTVAKLAVKFSEELPKLALRGALLDGQVLPVAEVKALATLPAREVLLAQLLGVLQAPATQLLRTLNEPAARVARLVDAIGKRAGSGADEGNAAS